MTRLFSLRPNAVKFDQKAANSLSRMKNLIILCGHYKALDERVRQTLVTMEFSVGDVVVSGGEIPALFLMDRSLCALYPAYLATVNRL